MSLLRQKKYVKKLFVCPGVTGNTQLLISRMALKKHYKI